MPRRSRQDRRFERFEAEEIREKAAPAVAPSRFRPRTAGQRDLLEAIDDHDIVYGLGPAGSGKTAACVAKAVEALKAGDVLRLILMRPTIEAGPTLGFLPGTLEEKVSPYLRPLLDELGNHYAAKDLKKLLEDGTIELTSLGLCRGRTFKHAVVILDEAQNATFSDFDLFLTRLGEGSQYLITGDVSRREDGSLKQCDLPRHEQGALEKNAARFLHIEGIAAVTLTAADIVRHPLVRKMVEAGL